MVDPLIALSFFDRLLAVLGLIRENDRIAEKRKDEALAAIYAALNETKAYIVERESGAQRDHQREFRIAQLWHTASIPLRLIDPEFAERCFVKGGYWMQPGAWSAEQIQAKGIAIDQVMGETQNLLTRKGH